MAAVDGQASADAGAGAGHGLSLTVRAALEEERPRFFLWAPVWLGAGIAVYFALLREPGLAASFAPALVFAILLACMARGTLAAVAATGLLLAGLGFVAAKLRVEAVRAPVLERQLTNVDLAGRVERVEARAPRGHRITLAVETLGGLGADATPHRVRVRTLGSKAAAADLQPGTRVKMRVTLSPPAKPAIPGGFDFARAAYFERLGGVGYTFAPVVRLPAEGPPDWRQRYALAVEAVRAALNARIGSVLPGETGAIAAALITGERGGISDATNEAYRNSGLFHILSISGLHMVVMAGAVFFSVRLLLAAIPGLALRFAIKKWAAVAGILGALCYLAISGGAFATVRAAVQIVIMFLAILLDRPALALRNVALAAFVILLVFPESLFDPGFQMSFAAVAALVASYEEVRRRYSNPSEPHPVLRVLMFFGGIVLSTLIASAAVAPFAAYHFHQSQQFALIANLLAIPICNFVVMPAALCALLLMPFGLEALPLIVMGKGIEAMTWCAGLVATLPGAVVHIPAMPVLAFLLLVCGGLWVIVWQSRWRLAGAALAVAGLAHATTLPRPDVLIARSGELVAVRGADGTLSALPARQAQFELKRWLEHDGDARKPQDVAQAAAFRCDTVGCVARVKGLALSVARHPAAIVDDCGAADVLVLDVPRPKQTCARPSRIIDVFDVWREGTHALYVVEEAPGQPAAVRIETVAASRGERPWSMPTMPVVRGNEHSDASGGGRSKAGTASQKGAGTREALPRFAPKADWLTQGPPRAEIEDDEGGFGPTSEDETPVEEAGPR
jgi:competence protein ComEC